jgi:hypothetical protein
MNTAGPDRDDAGAEPGAGRVSSWLLIAAAFLALEGITTIAYAGFLPPPIIDAGVTVPVLGRLPFVWLATGGLALVAAVGVFRKRTWGRYLGTVSAILAIVGALTTATSVPSAAIALAFPLLILFALWRRWPVPATT